MAEHVVGTLADFPPGRHRVVRVGRVAVGIFNVDGALYALPNVCPHQFGPLCEGTLDGTMVCTAATGWKHEWDAEQRIVTCPWHGIEFDVTTGRALARPGLRVRHYRVRVDGETVKIAL